MADTTPPAVPVTNQPAPDTTPPPALSKPAPVTPQAQSQATPAQPQPPPKPELDVTQAAETFAALNKLFDEQPAAPAPVSPLVETKPVGPTTTPAGQAPAAKPPEPTPIGTDLQKQLDAIKAPAGAHPNVGAGIDQLKKIATTQEQKVVEYQTKLQDLEKKVQTYETQSKDGKLPEPVEKELKDLREFRREIDMRQDSEFQQNYVKPVQTAEQEMMGMLQQVGVTEETLKYIQENGGVIAVSQSQEKANDKQTMAEWLEESILGRINTVTRNRLMSKLAGATDILEKGQKELTDWRENGQKRYEMRMRKLTEDFNSGRDEAIRSLGDLVKPKTIDASMSAEDRVAAEQHNSLLRQAEQKYTDYLKISQQPKTAGEILVKATQADMILSLYSQEKAKTKDLQERLDRVKASGAHSQAGDHTPPAGQQPPVMSDLLKKPTDQAMNELFNSAGITR